MDIRHCVKTLFLRKKSAHVSNSGLITIEVVDNYDSGLALLLIKPPQKEHKLAYQDSIFEVSPDSIYCICKFSNAKSHEEAFMRGILIIQECLDLLSMRGEVDLATRDVTKEYFVWWNEDKMKIFTYVETFILSFSVGNPTITLRDKDGNIIPPVPIIPIYSPAFRYYRLSQISDDLFDAFRNMYLAFEFLLSSHYPKNSESEIDWLKRALQSSEIDLNLHNIVPKGTQSIVDFIIEKIYINARLPLFHSKSGKNVFAPNNLKDRTTVSTALNLLTKIVIQMADHWYSCRRMSGWVNLKFLEESYEKLLVNSSFVYCDDPQYTENDTVKSKSIKKGIKYLTHFKTTFLNEDVPNIEGEVSLSLLEHRLPLSAIVAINEEKTLLISKPERKLKIKGFDSFRTIFILRGNNASQPRSSYSR